MEEALVEGCDICGEDHDTSECQHLLEDATDSTTPALSR